MILKHGTQLQSGRYIIEKVIGQGGFGITYLAVRTAFNEKVAVKEFFMKELCNRDAESSKVSVGSAGSRDAVERFRQKFLKEAQNIYRLKHRHIIPVIDVFEENGTAYYVMEYVGGGSLADKVSNGALPETAALRYIRQVAEALDFVHGNRMMHLDIKPANILVDDSDNAVLIDFGLSKQYDGEGQQTSTTPVGISHGYAPIEQYRRSGVSSFSPAADIYSLGATLFKLVTGKTPPEAGDVISDGLPQLPATLSLPVRNAIKAAMQPARKDRPQSVAEFLSLLDDGNVIVEDNDATQLTKTTGDDDTIIVPLPRPSDKERVAVEGNGKKNWLLIIIGVVLSVVAAILIVLFAGGGYDHDGYYDHKSSYVDPEKEPRYDDGMESYHDNSEPVLPVQPVAQYVHCDREFMVNGIRFKMVAVDGGTFRMGATEEQQKAGKDEYPVHTVTLSDYYIAETEVTQQLWEAVMGYNPSHFVGSYNPVEKVSYNDCMLFVARLNDLLADELPEGHRFRLPSEAQWEFAARGGNRSNGYQYSGDYSLGGIAWYKGNSNFKTHAVKSKSPNELGIYDMSGNVYEWCSDWYGNYSSGSQTNPEGPLSGKDRVLRGGCWSYGAEYCRVTFRSNREPGYNGNNRGLRLAL